ncbi:MAG: hypothetical protein JOZ47_19110 [Kutzneria sp.]|nr:hypothetical protein [Kutzneria sp.]MBV9847155.1 hypothetical protein [Kutzneria sp.]
MGVSDTDQDSTLGQDSSRTVTEELRLLLEAVAERAEPWLQRLGTGKDGTEHVEGSCDWCPVCAVAAVLRGERSELAAKAAEHAAGLLAVLRMAMRQPPDAPPADTPAPSGERTARAGEESDSARPPRVRKIAVHRGAGGQPRC